MTPRELLLIVDEYNERHRRDREDALTTAYLTAYLHRVKRMPGLKEFLEDAAPKPPKETQSDEDMFTQIKQIHARLEREEG